MVVVADTHNHCIRCIATDGQVTTFAGRARITGHLDGQKSKLSFIVQQYYLAL